jgi:AcrR family transcriptional regulator
VSTQRRTYDNLGRERQAGQRRAAILEACRAVLLRTGYAQLTIRAVAEEAGVSQETIYKGFRTKRGLVKALYDVTLAGDDEPVPMGQRPEVRALLAEADPRAVVAGYARLARQVADRIGALAAQLSSGGPEAAQITAETDRERLAGTAAFVGHLANSGHLRAGLDRARAADACWVLLSPQLYRMCTIDRGWTSDAYEAWLARMLAATLLPTVGA